MINSLELFDFIVRACIIWGVLFLTYKFFLAKSKWHKANRVLLMIFLLIPFLQPYFTITEYTDAIPLMETIVLPELQLTNLDNTTYFYSFNLTYLYLFIVLVFFIKYSINFYRTFQLKTDKPFFYYKNHKMYMLQDDTAFNFLNQIYIGKSLKNNTNILDHEIVHKRAKHSVDLLLITVLRSLFWIFPFWNLITKLFKENHEYYVDQKLLQTVKLSDYLKQIASAGPIKFDEQFGLTSNQMSIFKTRLQMMKNKHKSQIWRYVLMLGISGAVFVACDKTNIDSEDQTQTRETLNAPPLPPPPVPINPSNERSINLAEADTPPTWDGCNDGDVTCFQQGVMKFISANFIYPPLAKANGEEGKAYVGFQFSTTGEVKNIALRKKTDSKLLNEEAIRLIKLLPKAAKPAFKNGKPVAVQYIIPIKFQIK